MTFTRFKLSISAVLLISFLFISPQNANAETCTNAATKYTRVVYHGDSHAVAMRTLSGNNVNGVITIPSASNGVGLVSPANSQNPDIKQGDLVIVSLGSNDSEASKSDFKSALKNRVDYIKSKGGTPILMGATVANYSGLTTTQKNNMNNSINPAIQEVASETGAQFVSQSGTRTDGLHYDGNSYKQMVGNALAAGGIEKPCLSGTPIPPTITPTASTPTSTTNTTSPTSTTSNTSGGGTSGSSAPSGQQIMQSLANGSSTATQAAQAISQIANISNGDASKILQNLISQGTNVTQAGKLIDQITKGNIGSQLAQAVSATQALSQIKSIKDIGGLLSNPAIQQQLQKLVPAEAVKSLTALTGLLNGASGVKELVGKAGADLLVSALDKFAPELSKALKALFGGASGLSSMISGLASTQSGAGDTADGQGAGANANGNTPCPNSEKYQLTKPDCKPNPVNKPECKHCNEGNCSCRKPIEKNHKDIRAHVTGEFTKHRTWMIDELFTRHILPAMAQMTSQLSAVAVQQTKIVGTFFDAKHQLETQRLFQQLMAEAHKDYQPSEGMCEIGTSVRSLAASSRKSDLGHVAFANRAMGRQLRTTDILSAPSDNADFLSRLNMMTKNHCNKNDNAKGLNYLCANGGNSKERTNKDVDFTRTIESQLTLDVDFSDIGKSEAQAAMAAQSNANPMSGATGQPDAEDVFALTANLFAHNTLPGINRDIIATKEGDPREAAYKYMDLRSVAAKRSVALNSIAAIAAERGKGDKEVAKFLKKLVTELGVPDEDVEEILGKNPSYFAQMEVLSKDLYQNPTFYTELYDKPANVLRKGAAIRAISLMQERDLYKSQLRSEATLSVILETMLQEEQNRVSGELSNAEKGGNK